MTPVWNIVVTAMHVADGLLYSNREVVYIVGGEAGIGGIEVTMLVAPYVQVIFDEYSAHSEENWDFPGVFDYEVSYEFGAWWAKQFVESKGTAPSHADCLAEIERLVNTFFGKPL